MMDQLRSYILSVFAASMICSVVVRLTGERSAVMKLVCTLFLTICILRPIAQVDIRSIISYMPDSLSSVTDDLTRLESAGTQALRDGIQERTEAYILMEASSMGLQIDVEVSLTEDEVPVPDGAVIRGQLSPYERTKLYHILTSELGIRREGVTWS